MSQDQTLQILQLNILTLSHTILTFNNLKEKAFENIVGKGENAGFLLFQQCFQKDSFLGSRKPVIVWEKVKSLNCMVKSQIHIPLNYLSSNTSMFHCDT